MWPKNYFSDYILHNKSRPVGIRLAVAGCAGSCAGEICGLWQTVVHPYHLPMTQPVQQLRTITRIQAGVVSEMQDAVAMESVVTMFINDIEVATLLCTPSHIEALAVGFLVGEGVISKPEQVVDSSFQRGRGIVRVTVTDDVDLSPFSGKRSGTITSGCGKGQTYTFIRDVEQMPELAPGPSYSAAAISSRSKQFSRMSDTYQQTGGVHSAMLWDGADLALFCEDLGRHNAVDKVFGRAMLEGVSTSGRVLLTSGRMSSEIVLKCARAGVTVIVSRNAPTSFSVTLAELLHVTLIGFVRGDRMNLYTCPERITSD